MDRKQEVQPMKAERGDREKATQSLRVQKESSSAFISTPTCASLTRCYLDSKVADLEKTVQQLSNQLTDSRRAAAEEKDSRNETIQSLSEWCIATRTRASLTLMFVRKQKCVLGGDRPATP